MTFLTFFFCLEDSLAVRLVLYCLAPQSYHHHNLRELCQSLLCLRTILIMVRHILTFLNSFVQYYSIVDLRFFFGYRLYSLLRFCPMLVLGATSSLLTGYSWSTNSFTLLVLLLYSVSDFFFEIVLTHVSETIWYDFQAHSFKF